jgi:very-short-patch-repair endonuclease
LEGGCVLLEEEYINARTPMRYICSCGKKSKITYDNFANKGQRCTLCKNKTERIVVSYLEENFSSIIPQPKFEWCKNKRCLPFDFLLDDLKIIIEVDGPQHFIQVGNWWSPVKTQEKDTFKAKAALKRGYSVIRISQADISQNTIDWKTLLNDAIKEYSQATCVYISKNPELYDKHKALLE